LGEFYKPNFDYSYTVATRYFKGPELLLGMKQYDYSHDVWSIGCTFGALIFRRSYLFVGKDNFD
jgi:casein kinase II subunit alpha